MAIEQQRVHSIKHLDSLLEFLIKDLHWKYPKAEIEDISFEWTGDDLNLSEDIHLKLKGGLIRQLQPFAPHQPWGVFVVEFTTKDISIETLRQILRCFVAKRRNVRSDLPAWKCENLLFICLYGGNGFSFVHFKGDKPYAAKLTTFSWHPSEPIRTVCEFNLPALAYTDTWTPGTWVDEWQKAFDVEKVNKEFYRQIARFYYRLTGKEGFSRELTLPSVGDSPGNISYYEEFAVRLIGRTIFCWFLKHKESGAGTPLIPEEALSLKAAQNAREYYHLILEPLFFEVMNKPAKNRKQLSVPQNKTVPFLNGGLFDPHPYDFYLGSPNRGLKIPDDWFIEFFTLLEHYNFTITENSSINIDVAVDPEMLGRIFENLLAEVVPETGETARKATGSYYTPRAIVDYMVEQSLKQYLLTKTNLGEEKVGRLLEYGEDIEDFNTEERLQIVTAFREIKVIDPACGSGAFPMGILHRMLAVMEKADSRLEIWRSQYLKTLDGIVRLTVEKNISRENWAYIRKLIVIRDSIYGVDIQPIAVEIAKLRCFLSLVVDEIVIDNEENRGIEPLPNLEFKFVAANTLIGLPAKIEDFGAFEARDLTEKLKKLRIEYLTDIGETKEQLKKEFLKVQAQLRAKIDWALPTSQSHKLATWDPFSYESCSWFDPNWMFGIEDGFDVVIANPPYIQLQSIQQEADHLEKMRYQSFTRMGDIYCLFYERGYSLLTNGGVLSFITSNKWIRAGYGKAIREFFATKTNPLRLIDFAGQRVFDSATVDVSIMIFKKGTNKGQTEACVVKDDCLNNLSVYIERNSTANRFDSSDNWTILSPIEQRIKSKIEAAGVPLRDWDVKINYGIKTGLNEAFIIDRAKKDELIAADPKSAEIIRPILRGRDIKRYTHEFADLWLIDTHNGIRDKKIPPVNVNSFPAIKTHLDQFYTALEKRLDKGDTPYNLRSCAYTDDFYKQKILWGEISDIPKFSFDTEGEFLTDVTTFIMTGESLGFLMCFLNSRLSEYYFSKIGTTTGVGTVRWKKYKIETLRIPKLTDNEQTPFTLILNKILYQKHKSLNTTALEKILDTMIYELFDFSEEEIQTIEEHI